MLANKVKISYALANYELSPPNSEEVERVNQLISWSYQVSIFRLVLGKLFLIFDLLSNNSDIDVFLSRL